MDSGLFMSSSIGSYSNRYSQVGASKPDPSITLFCTMISFVFSSLSSFSPLGGGRVKDDKAFVSQIQPRNVTPIHPSSIARNSVTNDEFQGFDKPINEPLKSPLERERDNTNGIGRLSISGRLSTIKDPIKVPESTIEDGKNKIQSGRNF